MKKSHKTYVCSILSFLFISLVTLKPIKNEDIYKLSAVTSERLVIKNEPFLKKLPLGSRLYTNGLAVVFDDNLLSDNDYNVIGYNANDLGEQDITINYKDFATTFNVFVTNEFALVGDYFERGLFISKVIVEDDNLLALQLFNATYEPISLKNYEIEIQGSIKSQLIALDETIIKSKEAYNISFTESIVGQVAYELLVNDKIISIELSLDGQVFDFFKMSFVSIITDESTNATSINRHPSILKPNKHGAVDEWFYSTNVLTNLVAHIINDHTITYKEQARAFARYVMFGAGMFAKDRVEEAFLALRSEFELMHPSSINFFVNNPKEKVNGINETGKSVEVTFSNAYERINVLASNSGHPSFINTKRWPNITFSNTIPIVLLSTITMLGYFVLMFIKKQKTKT